MIEQITNLRIQGNTETQELNPVEHPYEWVMPSLD